MKTLYNRTINYALILIIMLFYTNYSIAQITSEPPAKPKTNIEDALKYARNENSMPGKYPGKVVQVNHESCTSENKIIYQAAYDMVENGMLSLTGEKNIKAAWRKFVSPKERIGLKVNPVAGPQLSTSVEVTKAIVSQLEIAGVKRSNILIWDRREEQLFEAGFNHENFPGIKIIGTERPENGSMYDEKGKLHSLKMIDTTWYYWADCEDKYDSATIPYMVNEGKYSYFTKIVTEMVDKIINVPILKNAGSSVTLCLKNLAYGSVTNTGRLHKQLWAETCAEVNAFPPLRDKVVLNIVDGIKGCFNGGPGANPQFFCEYKTVLVGTDPVAVDRIGYNIVINERIKRGVQKEDNARGRIFMDLAQNLNLGIAVLEKIKWEKIELK
ncbi:MAG: DUF362 domain-containing protein [Melioribacter sp.]|nr:DUF362 domain-containing protein [Melioribacter sp.]